MHPRGYTLGLSQPLFQGFQTVNAVRQAKESVLSAHEALRAVEQTVLLDAVNAYADVARDQEIVRLRANNVQQLAAERASVKGQLVLGEVTSTDLAQAEARYSQALALLNAGRGNLEASEARYEEVIGCPPGELSPPAPIFGDLSSGSAAALAEADAQNPLILSALHQFEAARYATSRIKGELLPTVSLQAQYQNDHEPELGLESQEQTSVLGRVTMPLYQGGAVTARVRQAVQVTDQYQQHLDSARLRVRSQVVSSWALMRSTAAQIVSARAAVASNRSALKGMQREQSIGQRSTLDVLNAQLELLNAQVTLAVATRDSIVAGYSLAASIGLLDGRGLGLSAPDTPTETHHYVIANDLLGFRE
jgi:outer membrane protein